MKKKIIFTFIIIVVIVAIVFFWQYQAQPTQPKKITFAQCEELGGTAWAVNVHHPDICPSCAEYDKCYKEFNDYSDVCPVCDEKKTECEGEALYEKCLYDSCRDCKNSYLHDFENDDEMFNLCPECKLFEDCRKEFHEELVKCFEPCTSCQKNNKKYEDIREVCPSIELCYACEKLNGQYPDKCPDEKKKIGEITDAAIEFQCCK